MLKPVAWIVCGGLLLLSRSIPAATFNVAAGDVAGLKTAITMANGNNQDDVIILTNSTYTLTARDNGLNGLPAIGADSGHSLTIQGNGSTILRSGSTTFRFIYVNSGANLTLSGLTLTNGTPGTFHGGAIYNDGTNAPATLTLINCTLSGNTGDYGGAIWNDGSDGGLGGNAATLTIANCTFTSNTGTQYGGAIWNESGQITMNVSNSTFTLNSAGARSAGAIQFDASNGVATGSIMGCTFSQNSAANYGGAVNVDGFSGNASLTISNCTFSHNSANWGGALASDGSSGNATVTVASCTFSGNSATTLGNAIYLSTTGAGTTSLPIGNTLLENGGTSGNIGTQTFSGGAVSVSSQGYNLTDDDAGGGAGTGPGGLLNHPGDIRNTNPLLDPAGLKDNGGPTFTIALQATSPALDQGKSTAAASIFGGGTDQRGEFRPFDDPFTANAAGGDASDIGAYEATVRGVSESRSGPMMTTLNFSFLTILGHTYEIQSRPSLTSGTWTTVSTSVPPPPISGTGGVVSITVPNAIGSGPGYYRAHQL